MKIALLYALSNKNEYFSKEVMGGYGEACRIGNSFPAKIIEHAKKKGVRLPLMSFGYIAAILKKNGHDVRFFLNRIPEGFDLIIIASSVIDYKNELEFARRAKMTGAKVGFIGPFASAKPELFLKIADFVIKGEPEYIVNKINENWIPSGAVKSKQIQNLDELPFPDWEIFPYKDFSYYPALKKKLFFPVLSSRGCTLNCNYCPYKAHYGKWRTRSVPNIIKELKYLISKFGAKSILFRDPLFTAVKKRAVEIANALIKENLDIEWACETHLAHLNKDLLDILYKSGLRAINVGIESIDAEVLKTASRINADAEHQKKIIKYCDKTGIKVSAFYMLGMPIDTEETIKRTIKYAKELNTHTAQFFIFTPFPGTEYYNSVKDRITTDNWEEFNSFTPVFKHENLAKEELLKLKEKAFVSYYFRPKYILSYIKRMYLR